MQVRCKMTVKEGGAGIKSGWLGEREQGQTTHHDHLTGTLSCCGEDDSPFEWSSLR